MLLFPFCGQNTETTSENLTTTTEITTTTTEIITTTTTTPSVVKEEEVIDENYLDDSYSPGFSPNKLMQYEEDVKWLYQPETRNSLVKDIVINNSISETTEYKNTVIFIDDEICQNDEWIIEQASSENLTAEEYCNKAVKVTSYNNVRVPYFMDTIDEKYQNIEAQGGDSQLPPPFLPGEQGDSPFAGINLPATDEENICDFYMLEPTSSEQYSGAILVQKGTLKKGDMILVGEQTKRVRSLVDENGKVLAEAGPSVPASITGLDVPPKAGDEFVVVTSEKMAKEISNERAEKAREERLARNQISNLEMLFDSELGNHTILNIVLKADTHGSLEAIIGSLKNIENEEVKINLVHESVGSINANDVNLALTTNAFVMGFNVRADNAAKSLAEKESIEILYYSIIYDLIDGIKTSIEGKLAPDVKEEILGTAEVKDIFKSPKFGLIAGSIVIEGTIKRNKPIRVLRDDIVIFEGELDSLKRFKDDASEVPMGTECGIGVANYRDVKIGDKIEVFDRIEVKRTLD